VEAWLGQYCINVTDLERSIRFYEALGLACTSRTEIPQALEAIVEAPGGAKGGKLQLAQQRAQQGAIDHGNAFWKLYVSTNDIEKLYKAALLGGAESVEAPKRAERWPVTIAFVRDPDGYLVELVQRHPWKDGDATTLAWIGQYCINVSDLERSVAFYEMLGLVCTSRTEIPGAQEAIVQHPARGGQCQLAQQKSQDGPIRRGSAFWKLYVHTDDCAGLHARAVGRAARP
jgi:catechol 2,3-dioxygenase-like lactoylglutathione lyase family enzyme